ncbi:MAG: 3'-5' exonuclease [Verrucomicrobiota bacterium]
MLDSPLSAIPWAALDFEGAGELPGYTDVPIQVGLVQATGIEPPLAVRQFRSFIAAHRPVALAARRVHGITDRDLTDAPELASLWPELKARLGDHVVVAHNASVEKRYLRAFPGHGFGPWVDTLTLTRRLYPNLESHRLGDLVAAFGLTPALDALCPQLAWHDALYDAAASLLVLQHTIRAAGLQEKPLRILF